MKKKVAQTLYSGTGGHASVVFNMLENGGFEEWDNYLYFYGVEELESGHQEFCERNQIFYDSSVKKSRFDIRGYWKIFKFFLHARPDVLLIHNPTIFIPALLYYFLFRPKLITVDHIPNNYKRKAELFFLKVMTFFTDELVVLNSQHVTELVNSHPFFEKYKSKINEIPNGMSYLKFGERKYIKNRIGMVSRFSRQKDQKTLIRAVAQVIEKGKDIHLYLIGSGDTYQECQDLASELGISDAITFTGNIKFDDAQKLCATFQLFVMSTFAETVGMTVLEAFAQRVPVLASEVEGIVDYMVEGENGFLVPAQQPELMAQRIIELLEQEDAFFEPIIANGLKTIDSRFNARATFESYNALT